MTEQPPDPARYTDNDLFHRLASEVRPLLADDGSGHGLDHAWRVFALATRIAAAEGADPEVCGAAALVHDVHRVLDSDGDRDGADDGLGVHPRESLPVVRDLLDAAGVPEDRHDAIAHAVAVHDEYAYLGNPDAPDTLEAEVLQDADNLDATGAMGVARLFAFAGAHGNRLWGHPEDADEDAPTRAHVFEKLVQLPEEMNTAAGRELARKRHAFLLETVDRLDAEWAGER